MCQDKSRENANAALNEHAAVGYHKGKSECAGDETGRHRFYAVRMKSDLRIHRSHKKGGGKTRWNYIKRYRKRRQGINPRKEIHDDTVWIGILKSGPEETCILRAGVPAS